jgi:glycosyltransferase involved in cell wall biosynthesis
MRVLQIIHGNEAGGVKTLGEIIGAGLGERGVAVETAILFPRPGLAGKLAGIASVARKILFGRYDAVIGYQSTACLLTGVVGRLARVPHRIAHQTALPDEVRPKMRALDRIAGSLGFYTQNIANSRATLAAFAGYPARYRAAMTLIEHGVAAPKPKSGRAATLARFSIPSDGRILLNTGRLTEQKNQYVLIRALARVPNARLVIAGGGPEYEDFEVLATSVGVRDRLHLLGDVTRADVADLLGACDLFVFPSTWETFGLSAVEAAMTGVPIVASDIAVLREVLSSPDGDGATFVAPYDVEGWARAIAQHVHVRPAAQAIAQRYSVARMIDAYAALLSAAAWPSRHPVANPQAASTRPDAGRVDGAAVSSVSK